LLYALHDCGKEAGRGNQFRLGGQNGFNLTVDPHAPVESSALLFVAV
jgi:hypothetical protein